MEINEVKMKCKRDVCEERFNVMYDNINMELTKNRWYKIHISKFRISVCDNKYYYFVLTSSDLKEFFYSEQELRKIKIEKILN
jgi:hypothetical protein